MSRDTATVFDHLHQYGVDIRQRRIFLHGPIWAAGSEGGSTIPIGIDHVIRNFLWLDKTKGDIELFICTQGGSIVDGFGLYDLVIASANNVTGVVYGECCSAGLFPLLACDHRYATKNAWFMWHRSGTGVDYGESLDDASKRIEMEERVDERTNQIMGERTSKDKGWWKNKLKQGELWLDAEEMMEIGLISELWNGEG